MMHGNESRAALYHRFHFLLPFVYNPVVRRGWRLLVWAFWLVYFFFILAILALRYIVLPNVEEYRPAIERLVSEGLVRVGLDKDGPRELARYAFGKRVRSVIQGPDGALWVAEDGKNARLLKLTPRR